MLEFLTFPWSFGKQCFVVVDAPYNKVEVGVSSSVWVGGSSSVRGGVERKSTVGAGVRGSSSVGRGVEQGSTVGVGVKGSSTVGERVSFSVEVGVGVSSTVGVGRRSTVGVEGSPSVEVEVEGNSVALNRTMWHCWLLWDGPSDNG